MELFRALAVLAEPPAPEMASVAAALELGALPVASEYTEIFVFQLYPYASVYLGAEGMLGGEARDRVAGFWRALSQMPPAEPDHLSVMLALYAHLSELEANADGDAPRASWRRARAAYLWEHLLSWLPAYLSKLQEIAPPFYRRWGETLRDALREEARATGAPPQLPLHLREAAGLVDPRAGETAEFLQTLLSPARSGMILVRSDLSRAARTLSLGLRAGERKYVLESLFAQDARGVLGWLAREARVWSERHRLEPAPLAVCARAWEAKADASAQLLEELKAATADAEAETTPETTSD
ncbi:MAG TPA: molecular chaperone TorD family protein [Pyrinomonadaceae bacterium]|jgi:TorA maturation chaperone TorD|nr:molecular chaperone TorD family protein [Pyrinomonadaceae bacterium]